MCILIVSDELLQKQHEIGAFIFQNVLSEKESKKNIPFIADPQNENV